LEQSEGFFSRSDAATAEKDVFVFRRCASAPLREIRDLGVEHEIAPPPRKLGKPRRLKSLYRSGTFDCLNRMASPQTICVIGIGKLGLSMAAAVASRGYQVIGVDIRQEVVDAVNRGESPVVETGLRKLIRDHKEKIRATTDLAKAVRSSDASFVVVATPLQADKRFSNAYLLEAVKSIGTALRGGKKPHMVSIVSTVMPGTVNHLIKPLLEKESGRKCGTDLMLAYNPEFIALGSVVRNFLNPDWVLAGVDSPAAGDWLEAFYKKVCTNDPPVMRMSPVSAEIAKLAQNCFVTTKISFANSIAAICENVPGADARTILKAMGHDKRVGEKALLPGLGFGGPCFPRDNLAFQSFAKEFGCEAPLAGAVQQVNEALPLRVARSIAALLEPHSTIAILGAAYKTDTDIIEESHAVLIGRRLADEGYRVRITDPLAASRLEAEAGEHFTVVSSAADACRGAHACFFGLPLYGDLTIDHLAEWMSPPRLIVDPWATLTSAASDKRFSYLAIGAGKKA